MTRSINRQARARMRAEGKLTVIDGGKAKPRELMVQETLLLPKSVADTVTKLHQLIDAQNVSRHDLLVDIFKEGLATVVAAIQRKAERSRRQPSRSRRSG